MRRHAPHRTPGRKAWTEEILDAVRRTRTQAEAARVLGISPSLVWWHVNRHGKRSDRSKVQCDRINTSFITTADLDRRVVFLKRCGMSPRGIAQYLDVTQTKVNRALKRI